MTDAAVVAAEMAAEFPLVIEVSSTMPVDLLALVKPFAELGAFGLLAGVLFYLLPRVLNQMKVISDSFVVAMEKHRHSYANELLALRVQANEDRATFVLALDRNTTAMAANTAAIGLLRSELFHPGHPGPAGHSGDSGQAGRPNQRQ